MNIVVSQSIISALVSILKSILSLYLFPIRQDPQLFKRIYIYLYLPYEKIDAKRGKNMMFSQLCHNDKSLFCMCGKFNDKMGVKIVLNTTVGNFLYLINFNEALMMLICFVFLLKSYFVSRISMILIVWKEGDGCHSIALINISTWATVGFVFFRVIVVIVDFHHNRDNKVSLDENNF